MGNAALTRRRKAENEQYVRDYNPFGRPGLPPGLTAIIGVPRPPLITGLTDEEFKKKYPKPRYPDFWRFVRELCLGLFVAWLYALYLASQTPLAVASHRKIAVLGALDFEKPLTREFRRFGLDFNGVDGSVSWRQLAYYAQPKNDSFYSSSGFNLANATNETTRWQACAGDCPFVPVVAVSHPLRALESLALRFCGSDDPELEVADALLGFLPKKRSFPFFGRRQASCLENVARYWHAYYSKVRETLSDDVMVFKRENTTVCDFLDALNATYDLESHRRFKRAKYFCNTRKTSRLPLMRHVAVEFRQLLFDLKAGVYREWYASLNHQNNLTWDTLNESIADPRLRRGLAEIARYYGYDDAPL